jgi:Ca-activated chloride channel homolog
MFVLCVSIRRREKIAALSGFVLAVVAGFLTAAAAPAETAEPVSLYVTVVKDDKLIGGLGQSNFRLYEDGQPRDFRLAEPETPASIALLAEYSQSSSLYFGDIQSAIQGFLREVPEGNWYAFATFSSRTEVNVDFTKLSGRIGEAFSDLGQPMSSEINTYDAVFELLDAMGRLPGRRILIVAGSGLDTFSERSLNQVRDKLRSANVTIYAVGAGSPLRGSYSLYLDTSTRMRLLQAESFLRMLPNETGGEAWFPKFQSAFPDVMKGIVQDVAFQYRLVYVPKVPRDGKFHKIKVEAFQIVDDKRQDFKVLARAGWQF